MLALLIYTYDMLCSTAKVNTFTIYMSPMMPDKLTIVLSAFSYLGNCLTRSAGVSAAFVVVHLFGELCLLNI